MKKRLLLGLILLIFTLLILISCEESTAVNTPQESENSEYSSSEACEHTFSEWEEIKKPSCITLFTLVITALPKKLKYSFSGLFI